MNIKKSIACMALMISTGYSSLITPREFEDNLNNAITGRYTFNGKESQEPGLNESFEYYRAVEGFTGNWFKRDKELLSLAIAAGKFGINTEFMWTLYNMASMGVLRVEERDEIPYERSYVREEVPHDISPIYSRKNSEEIEHIEEDLIDTRNAYNTVIEEEPGEEEPEPKVEPTEQKPKEFSEELEKSVNAKCKEALEGDKKLSTLLGKMASCQEVELLGTMLDKLNKADFKGNDNKELTIDSFNQMAEPVKAKLFLEKPTLEDVGGNQENFEIAKKIAEKKFRYYLQLIGALSKLDPDELNLIATNEKYKNAIITYSANDLRLMDKNKKPLTSETFNEIVVAAKARLLLEKPTLEDIGNNEADFEIAKKIAEMEPAFCDYIFLIGALSKLDPDELNLIATNEKYKNAIITYSVSSDLLKFFDNNQPLTTDTFDQIVVSELINKADKKKTLDEIKQNFSTVIEKNKELEEAIEEKEKNYK